MFSSRQGFMNALVIKESDGFAESGKVFSWSNKDLDPTPPEERTWAWQVIHSTHTAYGFSTGVWTLGSSMIAAGLTVGQAVGCVFVAHTLGAMAIVVNSRFGAYVWFQTSRLMPRYPVYQRISFGPFGSFFPVLLRCGTGIIWVGVQLYQGGLFTSVILRCIFGHKWYNIKNTLPASADISTINLAATLIFAAITLPLLFMDIHKTRILWTFKSFILPPCVIGLFIYTQVMSRGGGANTFTTVKHYKGATLAWTMLKMINSAMGKTSPSQVNQPDLARYSKTRSAPQISQMLALPIANTAVACFGIFATSAVYAEWGTLIWNPWSLCHAILDHHWKGSVRFAIFLVSLAWTLSIFVSNQAANVIPFGADMAALLPKWLSIKRGMVLSYALGILINPWYILTSATSFLAFLSGYSIFLGPIVGVSAADYFWRKGNIHVPSLYTGAKDGHYYYGCGFSWRAYTAFWLGCIPTIPGFAGTFGHKLPIGFTHLFYIGWLYSIVSSAILYLIIVNVFPEKHMTEARAAPFESWADEQQELLDRMVQQGSSEGSVEEKVDGSRIGVAQV
ncbi:hypothetical protein MNV49_005709 [Pseudohyphozyma bogoriensis]|nr:hypothetical protein MNV49_005709 [Pseudohyphozyma bogoriensis]